MLQRITILAPLLTVAPACAGILIDFNGSPVTAEYTAPDPGLAQYLHRAFVWQSTPDQIVFGGFFPDEYNPFYPGGHGWVIAAPSSLDAGTPSPWSLEIWSANPAVARVNITGLADPFWQPPAIYSPGEWLTVGEITSRFDTLTMISTADVADVYDIRGVPVDASGNPWLVVAPPQVTMTNDGPIPLSESTPITPTPEPATLAMFAPLILTRKR